MTISPSFKRIHPLVAVAAASLTLFSLLGIAAITGVLPTSHSANVDASASPLQERGQPARGDGAGPVEQMPASTHAAKSAHTNPPAQPQHAAVAAGVAQQNAPVSNPQPAHKAPPQNSAVGIGVGAVIGGVLGNQVGSGDGKTLATILGAVGGGYVGNEIAKKNQ
jgi:hypothetical protein